LRGGNPDDVLHCLLVLSIVHVVLASPGSLDGGDSGGGARHLSPLVKQLERDLPPPPFAMLAIVG
jgi:hypothetical protein